MQGKKQFRKVKKEQSHERFVAAMRREATEGGRERERGREAENDWKELEIERKREGHRARQRG